MKVVVILDIIVAFIMAAASVAFFVAGSWGFGIWWGILAVVWLGIAYVNNQTRKIMDR